MCNPWDPCCPTNSCEEETIPNQKEEIDLYPSDDGENPAYASLDGLYEIKSGQVLVFKPYIYSCFDVAKYILKKLEKEGPMPVMKLHKLLYYCQAWSLQWDGEKLFKEKIRAWLNSPGITELYNHHIDIYEIDYKNKIFDDTREIKDEFKRNLIDRIIEEYGSKTIDALTDLVLSEEPWKKARIGLSGKERGSNEIKLADMREYYSSVMF